MINRPGSVITDVIPLTTNMVQSPRQFTYSLKVLLLLPLVALVAIIWIGPQFKNQIAYSKIGFGRHLNTLDDGDIAHDRLEEWLHAQGYELCERGEFERQFENDRETWCITEDAGPKLYIYVRSNDTYFFCEVFYVDDRWKFQNNDVDESAINKKISALSSWFDQCDSLFVANSHEN